MESEDKISERWFELMEAGVLVPDGVDEENEIVYIIDSEKLQMFDPELYGKYIDDLDTYMASLISEGKVEILLDDDGDLVYAPNQEFDWISTE